MKYCPNCGKELFDEAVMCPGCKASFVKKFRLTVFHREQALPLINPAIKSEIDGLAPIPVKKGDSIVYELDEGMHFVKLTGQGRNNQLDINLNCDLMIMAEWNAATGGIDYRISQGQIQGSLPINFQESAPVSSPKADESTEIVPENTSSENTQVNESLPETENAVPLAGNETPVGEYYQPAENAYQATGNNENINQPEAEENSLQPQTAFCAVCGKPIPIGEKLCAACINAQMHSVQNQDVASVEPKKERKPLSKKTKTLIISLSAIVLAVVLAFGGFKLYKFIEQKRIDKVTETVESQIINMDNGNYSYVDENGNVASVEIYRADEGDGYVIWIYQYYLNSEKGLLDLENADNPSDTKMWILNETIERYDYSKTHSILYLSDDKSVKVNLDKDYNIVSFEYDKIKYTKTESGSNTDELLKELYDYLDRASACRNDSEKYEQRLRNSTFSNSGFSVPMDNALDTFFESYTVTVEPDREDDNIYYIYVSGDCYGYSYLYYAVGGYSDYLSTERVKFKYKYSVADDEMSVVDDDIDGYNLRYLYVYASLY